MIQIVDWQCQAQSFVDHGLHIDDARYQIATDSARKR
jgi:hypothetical protein